SDPVVHLVNPRYQHIDGRKCCASLDQIDGPVDLVLMCVPDPALESALQMAAARRDHSAVIFGSAWEAPADREAGQAGEPGEPGEPGSAGVPSLRERIKRIAAQSQMSVCGAGCMGFVNVAYGLRAIGYVEADPIPEGPLALVSCSGSAFSALLRTHRRFGWTLAVSSGQELVTPASAYLEYAVEIAATKVVALLLEQMSDPLGLRASLELARDSDVTVVALTVGASERGRAMVEAHSGALAGSDAGWEALFDACGVIRVRDIDEMADTLEIFSVSRRPGPKPPGGGGIATVHDSGAERALMVDVAAELSVRFAPICAETEADLEGILDSGLEPGNPLDLWGRGADIADTFGSALSVLADDPEVDAVCLSVDLVYEFDEDDSYEQALFDAFGRTTKPMALLSNLHSAIDPAGAGRLREAGIPVLEGTRTGLLALRHLLEWRDASASTMPRAHLVSKERKARWASRLSAGSLTGEESLALIYGYGIPVTKALPATDRNQAMKAAQMIGLPVVMKTDVPGIAHKSDVGGVVLGLSSLEDVGRAYDDLATRLGGRVLVAQSAPDGVEMAIGIVKDPGLGPLIVVGAGGVLVELLSDRSVALTPVDAACAKRMIDRLAVRALLDGARGATPVRMEALADAIVAVSQMAAEIGDTIEALDINPLRCNADGVVALDALVVPSS
ncbi:MAG: acetate--CoA ligase family protein, partial [Acidimicrobiales bacterium]